MKKPESRGRQPACYLRDPASCHRFTPVQLDSTSFRTSHHVHVFSTLSFVFLLVSDSQFTQWLGVWNSVLFLETSLRSDIVIFIGFILALLDIS